MNIKLSSIELEYSIAYGRDKPACAIFVNGIPTYSLHRATYGLLYTVYFDSTHVVPLRVLDTNVDIHKLHSSFKYCLYYLADES